MSQEKREGSLENIATDLVPAVTSTAVPNTPPQTPPPTKKSKKFWKRRKKSPSPSPILPALIGINLTARAIGLNLDISSARSSPDRSSQIPDISHASQVDQEFDAAIQPRGRGRRRERDDARRQMVVEAQVVQATVPENFQTRHEDVYAQPIKGDSARNPGQSRKNTNKSPRNKQISVEDVLDMQERQQRLEEKVLMQNDETREMVREVMTRQHEQQESIRRSHRSSEASYELNEIDQALMDENSRLIKKNSSLVEQNQNLHTVSETLKKSGKKGSPRTQIEELLNENDILRETVQRINIELENFQEKYGDLPNTTKSKRRTHVESLEPKQKWLTNVEYLSPLFISYDGQLKEKDKIIRMLNGNQDPDAKHKWNNLSEQNNLMTEEIQILMQQMEMAKSKTAETDTKHAREVAKLSKALAIAEAEAEVATETVKKLQTEFGDLRKAHEKVVAESAEKIPAKEYITAVTELKGEIDTITETYQKEIGGAMKKIKAIEEEKSILMLDVTDEKIKKKQLEGQIQALTQAYDKVQDKCKVLNSELEDSDKRNSECESHLAEVLRLMDKTSAERDALAALIEKEQRMTEQALKKTMLGKWEMGKMEQTVKQYKKQAANQMNEVTDKIRGLEESHQGRLHEYHREMSHLRRLLQDKQAMLDDVTHDKRLVESELENVWQAATSENHRIMDSFYKSKVLD